MHDRVLRPIRRCLLTQNYVVTTHADEEIAQDGLTLGDVEDVLLNGSIVERQRDDRTA